ncbi:hypothetical protein ACFSOX_23440 [Rhodoplanes azumiensis]|uniref:Uncharacterized protein n=1 Tax=Rhodoplanes azumiensis TaxID=1897628 RepID=A0ABW5AQ60_9BRAD
MTRALRAVVLPEHRNYGGSGAVPEVTILRVLTASVTPGRTDGANPESRRELFMFGWIPGSLAFARAPE